MFYGALDSNVKERHIPVVHAIGVCDSPDYFYSFVAGIADEMGIILPDSVNTEEFIRQHLVVHQGKGLGYALSTEEELDFVSQFAMDTGIALDPVYSGKALHNFVTHVLEEEDPEIFDGKNVVFFHTGGGLGLFAEEERLLTRMNLQSPVRRLDVYGKKAEGTVEI